ncbi:hypothetical protein GCM10025777_47400 [Membranihabitans marinus]|uniref:Uncharacterized protein n=1 Tax=Nesterenkonia rhizosphaerae TaxID=1348272 RepID=A0ABP9FW56_9MICC
MLSTAEAVTSRSKAKGPGAISGAAQRITMKAEALIKTVPHTARAGSNGVDRRRDGAAFGSGGWASTGA